MSRPGMVEEPVITSARVVVSMWWFYVIVVAGVYNGNLIAFLTAPTTELPINSLTELANSDMMFGTLRDAAFHGIIEKADSGVYKQLWDKVWYGMVWYGMIWYAVLCCGVVWSGLVWCVSVVWCRVWFGML